jgi:hypothetical protein
MTEDTYDVFLCYNSQDKATVEPLAHHLKDTFRVFYDLWEMIPGRPVQEQLEAALTKSQTYAVFIGSAGLGRWQNEEMRVAISPRVDEESKRVIPVLLPGASEDELPAFLRLRGYVDFRAGHDDTNALHRLDAAIRGVAPGAGPATGTASPPRHESRPPRVPVDVTKSADEVEHVKKLVEIKQKRLRVLEKQAAFKGVNAPADLVMEMEDLEAEIEELRGGDSTPRTPTPGPVPAAASDDRRPNPFHANFPVRDATRFVGRQDELRRLRDLLTHGCVALLGEPKIGKSSLVLELKRTWDGDVIGPIDFYGLEDRDDFYDALAKGLGLESSDWRGSVRPELRRRRALLLLDELDAAPPHKLDADDLGRLRAVCQQNRDLKLVAVSRRPVKDLFPDSGRGSPVYNFLTHFDLGPLNDEDVRRLLMPWGEGERLFEPAVVEEIVRLVGGHPAKAQLAAHHRYEGLFDSRHDWREAWEREWERLR